RPLAGGNSLMAEGTIQERLIPIRLLAMDVDGVLTDGGILLDGTDGESKRFHIADGLGIQLAINVGLTIVWISGRESPVVERRAKELGVQHLYQKTRNKSQAIAEMLGAYALNQANVAY